MRSKTQLIPTVLLTLAFSSAMTATCSAQESDSRSARTDPNLGDTSIQEEGRTDLPPNALQVARIIGIDAEIDRLLSLRISKSHDVSANPTLEALLLRQRITDGVVQASLDVDSVLEELNYEREQIDELRSVQRARRDRAIGSTNVAVFAAGTGLAVAGGILTMTDTTRDAGDAINLAAGGISTLFSLRSFRRIRGGKRPEWVLPSMLAPFFGVTGEQRNQYPEEIWNYLNSVPPSEESKQTRRERLLEHWKSSKRLDRTDSAEGQRRVTLLTTTHAADKKLNIELLNERAAMLADVSDQVAQIKHDLADLLRNLRSE